MRPLLAVAALLMLAACGRAPSEVYSERSLVVQSEGLALRPGLWTRAEDPDCPFDTAKPTGAWPDCASVYVVRPGHILTRYSADTIRLERYRLAAGYPAILELVVAGEAERTYFGVRPQVENGEVVTMKRWPATCAPRPKGDDGKLLPPLKGMAYDDSGRCPLADAGQLRSAVIASETWTEAPETLRWIRASES